MFREIYNDPKAPVSLAGSEEHGRQLRVVELDASPAESLPSVSAVSRTVTESISSSFGVKFEDENDVAFEVRRVNPEDTRPCVWDEPQSRPRYVKFS